MTTMKSVIEANIAADEWCQREVIVVATRPNDPSAWYDACDTANGFMALLNITNPMKAKTMFLQSLGELVTDMADGIAHEHLDDIANETAVLANERAWFEANNDGPSECCNLIDGAAEYLLGGNTKVCDAVFATFVRARAEVDGMGIGEAADALLTLWRSRCTKVEWANGTT